MSLVAYESSDESENESTILKPATEAETLSSILLSKKSKETVKITIPSLSKFKEDDDLDNLTNKKPKLSGTGSGLFSMLPPPKYSAGTESGFTPYVLTKKAPTLAATASNLKRKHDSDSTITTSKCQDSTEVSPTARVEDTDGQEIVNDFFSLETSETSKSTYLMPNPVTPKPTYMLEQQDVQPISGPVVGPLKSSSNQELYTIEPQDIPIPSSSQESEDLQTYAQEDVEQTLLAEEGFRKLQGRHREFEDLNIIEVKADDQLSDRKEWLMKSLTEESVHRPSRKKHDMPSQLQRRKHQITYLAFQVIVLLAALAVAMAVEDVIHHYGHHGGHGISRRYFQKSQGHGYGYAGMGRGYAGMGRGYAGMGQGYAGMGQGYAGMGHGGYGYAGLNYAAAPYGGYGYPGLYF